MTNILHQLEAAEDDANLAWLRSEIERLRLTDEEREAVDLAADWLSGVDMPIAACSRVAPAADTLRKLLGRLGGGK